MSAGSTPVKLTIEQTNLQSFAKAFREEADGKRLKSDLTRELKAVMVPAQAEVKAAIQSMPVKNASPVHGASMRAAVAQQIKVSVLYSGRNTGVSLRAAKGKYPRNFNSAPHNYNAASWFHPVFGSVVTTLRVTSGKHRGQFAGSTGTVEQTGKPNFFDGVVRPKQPELIDAIDKALEAMAERLSHRD